MNDRLNTQDVSALLTLMAVAREVSNTELEELTGIRITGDSRRRLNDLGFVESSRSAGNKPYVHKLTKDGKKRCRYEFAGERPKRPGYYGYAFFALLNSLDRFFERENREIDEVFQPAVAEGDLETRILLAYHRLTPEPGDWVQLTDLRQLLNGAPREDVDGVLKTMSRDPRVTLAPNPDRKSVTAADRAASVRIGGDDNHLIAIEES
jgi:hypothetical protein